jgi:hypothetical protein
MFSASPAPIPRFLSSFPRAKHSQPREITLSRVKDDHLTAFSSSHRSVFFLFPSLGLLLFPSSHRDEIRRGRSPRLLLFPPV